MEAHEILFIVIAVLGLLFGGAFWRKFNTVVRLMTELGELLVASGNLVMKTSKALEDRKITKAEAVLLVKAWQEVSIEFHDVYRVLVILLPSSAIKFLFRR